MTEQFRERFDGQHLADDTARVLSAVQDWATRTFPESAEQHAGGTCQWCPICQFVAVLRGERSDVTERVVEAGTALLSAFSSFANAFVEATAPAADTPDRDGESDFARPRVQRIDLGTASQSRTRPRPKPYPDAGA